MFPPKFSTILSIVSLILINCLNTLGFISPISSSTCFLVKKFHFSLTTLLLAFTSILLKYIDTSSPSATVSSALTFLNSSVFLKVIKLTTALKLGKSHLVEVK